MADTASSASGADASRPSHAQTLAASAASAVSSGASAATLDQIGLLDARSTYAPAGADDGAPAVGVYVDDDWVRLVDDDSRAFYYYCPATGQTSWQPPGTLVVAASRAARRPDASDYL